MILHPVNVSPAGRFPEPLTPVICMPAADGDGRAVLERVRPVAEAHLNFAALLICPNPDRHDTPESWADTLAAAQDQYPLMRRGLVFGHGYGACLAHGFAMHHPGDVLACAALSADAWLDPTATDAQLDPRALRDVAWMVGCATGEAADRIGAAERFQVGLTERGCRVDYLDWEGDATDLPAHALENVMHFFNEARGTQRAAA